MIFGRNERYTTDVLFEGKLVELYYESNGVEVEHAELLDEGRVLDNGWLAHSRACQDLADRQTLAYLNAAEMRG